MKKPQSRNLDEGFQKIAYYIVIRIYKANHRTDEFQARNIRIFLKLLYIYMV